MPRPMMFRDEVEEFYKGLRAQRSQNTRPAISEEAAQQFHAEQRRRHEREQARAEYYRTHDSTDGPFPGDE